MTEYYPQGNLATVLTSKTITDAIKLMKVLAKAVAFLHEKCYIPHKNLKPENILIF